MVNLHASQISLPGDQQTRAMAWSAMQHQLSKPAGQHSQGDDRDSAITSTCAAASTNEVLTWQLQCKLAPRQ
jgi:hypothetical protein